MPGPIGPKESFRLLLASLKNFLGHVYEREQTWKRGGQLEFLSLDESRTEAAESLFQAHATNTQPVNPDLLFRAHLGGDDS